MDKKAGRGWLVIAMIIILIAMGYWMYRNYRYYHPAQEAQMEQEVPELEIDTL